MDFVTKRHMRLCVFALALAIRIDRLKLLRKKQGLSQEELAPKVGVKYGTYRNWEQGVREPGTDAIIRLAELFKVSVDYLLGQTDIESYQLTAKDASDSEHGNDDSNALLEMLKNDPELRMVAKIQGELTPQGKKDLLKYAELLRNQRDAKWND